MKIDIKKVGTNLAIVGGILAVFGVSIASKYQELKDLWNIPTEFAQYKVESIAKDRIQDSIIYAQDEQLHMMIDVNEMTWELFRDMTDNKDGLQLYEFEDDDGELFTVDVRETAEKHKWAFVAQMFIPYPVNVDTDGRMYIMLHHSKKQNTYLQIKD